MTKTVRRGRIILYLDPKEIRPGQRFRAFCGSAWPCFIDVAGNLFTVNPDTKEVIRKKTFTVHGNRIPYVNVRNGKKRLDVIIATAIFRIRADYHRIGHFDGDVGNCDPLNIYLDITVETPKPTVTINLSGGKKMKVTDQEFAFLTFLSQGELRTDALKMSNLSDYEACLLLERMKSVQANRQRGRTEAERQWKGLEEKRRQDRIEMIKARN